MTESPLTPEERSDLDGVLIAHLKAKLAEARAELASARKALQFIVDIKNEEYGSDWLEIEEARRIASAALGQPK